MDKKKYIKDLVSSHIDHVANDMKSQIDKALNCGALDIDSYDPKVNGMVIPKIILVTLLENSADNLRCKGSSIEEEIKSEVDNLKCFV